MRFSVLKEFFSVLDDFFYGFAVPNRPQCPPSARISNVDSVLAFVGTVLLVPRFV